MMHRGCGRAVRTLRTFCDDRAAPSAPLLYFLCAKQMTYMVDVDVIVGVVSFRVRCQIVFLFFFVMLYLCTPLNTQMTPIMW